MTKKKREYPGHQDPVSVHHGQVFCSIAQRLLIDPPLCILGVLVLSSADPTAGLDTKACHSIDLTPVGCNLKGLVCVVHLYEIVENGLPVSVCFKDQAELRGRIDVTRGVRTKDNISRARVS